MKILTRHFVLVLTCSRIPLFLMGQEYDPCTADTDSDGILDGDDTDGDGVVDLVMFSGTYFRGDNCVLIMNADQVDIDGDGLGDACDPEPLVFDPNALNGIIVPNSYFCIEGIDVPDANFKAVLLANGFINTNGDQKISVEEAEAFIGTINVGNKEISNLIGIEAFTNIVSLACSQNQLTTLDLSANSALETINCFDNQLTQITLGSGSALTTLDVGKNQLGSIDISGYPNLDFLRVSENQLTNLDVSSNTLLTLLDADNSQLTA